MILLGLLTACSKTNYKTLTPITMPNLPIAGKEVGDELKKVCIGKDGSERCPHLMAWLNKVILFRKQYTIIQKEYFRT